MDSISCKLFYLQLSAHRLVTNIKEWKEKISMSHILRREPKVKSCNQQSEHLIESKFKRSEGRNSQWYNNHKEI